MTEQRTMTKQGDDDRAHDDDRTGGRLTEQGDDDRAEHDDRKGGR